MSNQAEFPKATRGEAGEEVRQIVSHLEFVQAARERLGESFRSEEFRI